MDLTLLCWSTTVRNRRVHILVFIGTFATDDPDKYLMSIWEFTDEFLGDFA